MRNRRAFHARGILLAATIMAGIALSAGLAGCKSSKPAEQQQPAAAGPQRYHLAGRVVSVSTAKQEVTVDHGDIPGFMSAMTMPYPVKNPTLLAPLSAEDQITADVVVNGNDVYLENINVVKKAEQAKPAAGGGAKPAESNGPKL